MRDLQEEVRKQRAGVWQALQAEFDATQAVLIDSVQEVTTVAPAEAVGLAARAVK